MRLLVTCRGRGIGKVLTWRVTPSTCLPVTLSHLMSLTSRFDRGRGFIRSWLGGVHLMFGPVVNSSLDSKR
jgi:hypothetical protein